MRITISPDVLRQHLPRTEHLVVTEDHIDIMGHMNTGYYSLVFSRASRETTNQMGVTVEYVQAERKGAFMLRNFTQFITEAYLNDTLNVYSRVIARSDKRVHYMHFMVNETHNRLAATMEVLTTFADLVERRSTKWPPHIRDTIDRTIAEHNVVDWSDAPVCGVLKP
jgi:acyl-CoA thioester hydrolase